MRSLVRATIMLAAATAAASAAVTAPRATPPALHPGRPRILDAPVRTSSIDPYPYLNGGSFTGPSSPHNPDPLQSYVWGSGVNASILQVIYLLPSTVTLTDGTDPSSFVGLDSLLAPFPSVTVMGAGGIQFDFGANHAAWVEFDSADMPQGELPALMMGVSEYNEYEICNLGPKIGTPVAYANGNVTTYRFEPNAQLYEGVRFAWLWVNSSSAALPWTITGLRLVAQAKPQNWVGQFSSPGDELLTRAWYVGAYTVRANLLADQFGSILIDRGDRIAWGGDSHVAQATSLVAFANYDFIFTASITTPSNGIESYSLMIVLSLVDLFDATGNATVVDFFGASVVPRLEHAHDIWGTRASLGFSNGWDDRMGSGFSNATCDECEAFYRFLAIRTWREWARVLTAVGLAQNASHWNAYADAAVNATRAAGPSWYAPLGLFAGSESILSGVATPAESAAIIAAQINDLVTVCPLNNYDTYRILDALAAANDLDRAYAVLHRCWDVQILLGATTTWESSMPDWELILNPSDGVPGFEDGFTSMAHPWSSGVTPWTTKYLLGVRPLTPGYSDFLVRPHIAGTMEGVEGTVPTPAGPIRVEVGRSTDGGEEEGEGRGESSQGEGEGQGVGESSQGKGEGKGVRARARVRVRVSAPPALRGRLELTRSLLDRLGLAGVTSVSARVEVEGEDGLVKTVLAVPALEVDEEGTAALVLPTGAAAVVVTLLGGAAAPAAVAVPPNPFPPISYPATFVARDELTQGNWIGVYGSAGYALFAFDGPDKHLISLPPFVASIEQAFGHATNGPWPTDGTDVRALQDPRNTSAPRKIGQYCVPVPWASGWDPSYPFDVLLTPEAEGAQTYRIAVYVVDFDSKGRKETVNLLDRLTFNPISPTVLLDGEGFVGGTWLVWEYNRSVRLRFNYVRGDNQVVSAILFDAVNATTTTESR
jgi:alpha-L-rhamnosidase